MNLVNPIEGVNQPLQNAWLTKHKRLTNSFVFTRDLVNPVGTATLL